jgi:cell wall-associated NlpC family hydrolase
MFPAAAASLLVATVAGGVVAIRVTTPAAAAPPPSSVASMTDTGVSSVSVRPDSPAPAATRLTPLTIATVWVKPKRVRPVDRPAIAARPRIGAWMDHQSLTARENLGHRAMTQVRHDETVVPLRRDAAWTKVRVPDQRGSKFPDGIIGWVPSRQLRPAGVPRQAGHAAHATGADFVAYARTFLGVRYLWSGMTRHGIDCSGLTSVVMQHFGIALARDAADQARQGRPVPRADLRPGDLVFFGDGDWTTIHHVGIYAGQGLVLHAPHTGTRVQLTPLALWTDYWGARRYG